MTARLDNSREERLLPLLELASRASTEPDVWNDFIAALSAELGDAAITLAVEPLNTTSSRAYHVHTSSDYLPTAAKLMARNKIPWSERDFSRVHFTDVADLVSEAELGNSAFYHEVMAPQGLALRAPLATVFGTHADLSLAAIVIFQRVGRRLFDAKDLAWLDLLAPHLRQCFEVSSILESTAQRDGAFTEVLDRLPLGVILLDSDGKACAMNTAARSIVALEDGLALSDGKPTATLRESRVALQHAVQTLVKVPTDSGLGYDQGFTIDRPSGLRPFSVMVTRILATRAIGTFANVVAGVFVSDSEPQKFEMREALGSQFELTEAEVELAGLICEGHSLESGAKLRGISIHTARSHLKQIFRKTDTKRQADLVRLVASGLPHLRKRVDRHGDD
jgi:DNA-binding CsgD family transcriptional regulator